MPSPRRGRARGRRPRLRDARAAGTRSGATSSGIETSCPSTVVAVVHGSTSTSIARAQYPAALRLDVVAKRQLVACAAGVVPVRTRLEPLRGEPLVVPDVERLPRRSVLPSPSPLSHPSSGKDDEEAVELRRAAPTENEAASSASRAARRAREPRGTWGDGRHAEPAGHVRRVEDGEHAEEAVRHDSGRESSRRRRAGRKESHGGHR